MARKTAPLAEDPVGARVAVLERVKARRPADQVRQYPAMDGGQPLVSRSPSGIDRTPPRDLQEWIDDREVGAFGGRVGLNPAEQCAHQILVSFRSGDQATVRRAVSEAGRGLDAHLRYLVNGVLEGWRSSAPGYAVNVAVAATGEARRLGWDRPPRKTRRGPEPLDQTPGRRVA